MPVLNIAGNLPNDVTKLLHTLLIGIQNAIGDDLIGIYLRGSLALGDFDPDTSDVDFLAVTKCPVSEKQFAVLHTFHNRVAQLPNRYSEDIEGAYLDLDSLKRFRAGGMHPTIYRGGVLQWSKHQTNWVLERWTIREHGITLVGPDPKDLIEPISPDELRATVAVRLRDWVDFADRVDDPAWRSPLNHVAYVVETMCRALYTLVYGDICSKPQAVVWACETLPEPWRSLIERSRLWRTDATTSPNDNMLSEVMQFVHWVASNEGITQVKVRDGFKSSNRED